MMNYIFTFAVIISLAASCFLGNLPQMSEAILDGAANAVNISIKLLSAMALWNGITEVASRCGITEKIDKLLSPLIRLIFPEYSKTSAASAISANISANLLGLGNAATPLGIEAMRRMQAQSGGSSASNETVRFVVFNSAAVTLIPTTAAALRQSAGSTAPFSIILPVWLTAVTALTAGLLAEKLLSKGWKL